MKTQEQKSAPRRSIVFRILPKLCAAGLAVIALGLSVGSIARAGLIYEQPHTGTGTVYHSAWVPPDGTVYDEILWDNFTLAANQAITEIRWRGGHDPLYATMGGTLQSFRIRIYASIAGGSQPDVSSTPLCQYQSGNTCGETLAGVFGGTTLNDYHFTLPSPFQAAGGTRYWLQITANETGFPEWGFAAGSGGNGSHFRKLEYQYQNISGDTAFSLYVSDAPTAEITASVDPAGTGTVFGAGIYPIGSNATLTATAAAGYGFSNWTVNGTQVSTAAKYTFTVSGNRALVAHFVPAFVISTDRSSVAGGHVSAGGTYNSGAQVTVTATPNTGHTFGGWYEWGATLVSSSPSYTFTATQDTLLVAQFDPLPATSVFDFDTATPATTTGQSMPATQTASGLTATFSATSGGWYVTNTIYYWVPLDFSGNFLSPTGYPSGAAKLLVVFDQPLTDVRLDFATGELAADYDTASLVRITAYQGSTANPPVGSASARGTWLSGSYPEGSVSFHSATRFDRITIDVPTGQGYPVSNLLFLDNLTAVRATATITTTVAAGGGGSISGGAAYPIGDMVTLTATPDAGYTFSGWIENGITLGTDATFSFTAAADRSIEGRFALIIPELSILSQSAGEMILAWPDGLPGWSLEESPDLGLGSWTASSLPVTVNGGQCEVTVPMTGAKRFYRLAHP